MYDFSVQLIITSEPIPRPRYGHVADTTYTLLTIQGGTNGDRDFYDEYRLGKFNNYTWNNVDPPKELYHGAVFGVDLDGWYHGGTKIGDANIPHIDVKYVFESISIDMIPSILSYLEKKDLVVLPCVSKHWKVGQLASINAFWKTLFEQNRNDRVVKYKEMYEKELVEILQGAEDPLGTHYKQALIYICDKMNRYRTEPQYCSKAEQLVQEARRDYFIPLPTILHEKKYARTEPEAKRVELRVGVLGDCVGKVRVFHGTNC